MLLFFFVFNLLIWLQISIIPALAISYQILNQPINNELTMFYLNIGNNQDILYFNITKGDVIYHKKEHICSPLFNQNECNTLLDSLSYVTYQEYYTPSREASSAQDNLAKRTDIISYAQKRFQFQSYLEIGCATDDNFEKLRSQFETSVCVDPQIGK